MRIISGFARGSKLTAPSGGNTRPTADMVREALFNILAEKVQHARVLDLFAGSGAVGLEALSRGASFTVFADKSGGAVSAIRQNIEKLRVLDKSYVIQAEAVKAAAICAKERYLFDIVYLDPPYGAGLIAKAIAAVKEYGLLAPGAVVIAESGSDEKHEYPGFHAGDVRRYGGTALNFINAETIMEAQ